MKALMGDREGLEAAIRELYAEPALVPASPWLGDERPAPAQRVEFSQSKNVLSWKSNETVTRWVVQFRKGEEWRTRILPGATHKLALPEGAKDIVITAVNQIGLLSEPVSVR